MNRVFLYGRISADPVVRYTPSQKKVLNVNLATSSYYKDKAGQRQEKTEWHRLVLWERNAEIVSEYAKKGSKLLVEGSLQTQKYTDANNIEKAVTEIVVERVQLCDSMKLSDQPTKQSSADDSESPDYAIPY